MSRSAGSRGWLVLGLACAAEFMVVLDASVVNVALPAIQAGLGFDPAGLSWVVTSYTLVFAGFLLLGGRLADVYGLRRLLLSGLVVFTLASVAGGLAPGAGVLIAARAVQALGAAVLAPASLTLLTTTFAEGSRRVRALAIWTALASAGGAAGSLLGGVLTEYLTWRSTLLINLPIGALAVLLGARAVTRTRPGSDAAAAGVRADAGAGAGRLDVVGASTATLGLAALTYALSEASIRGWGSTEVLVALGLAAVGLGTFVAQEVRWSREPLLPLRLFGLRAVAVGNITMVLSGMCLMPMWFFLSLYMQQGLGLSALQTGLGFLPHTLITVAVGAWAAPRLMGRAPARVLIAAGCVIAAAGMWWQSRVELGDTYLSAVLGPAIAISVGGGLLNTPLTTAVTSGVDARDAGAASGLMNTTKQLGGAVGLAALLTLATTGTAGAGLTAGPVELIAGVRVAFTVMAWLLVAVAALAAALPAPTGARDSSLDEDGVADAGSSVR